MLNMKTHVHNGVERSLNLLDVLQQTEYWVPKAQILAPQPILLTEMSCRYKRNAYNFLLRRAALVERVTHNQLLNYACDEIAQQGGSMNWLYEHEDKVRTLGVEGWMKTFPLMIELARQMDDEDFDGDLA